MSDIRCEFQKVGDAHGEEVSGHHGRGREHINHKGLTSVELQRKPLHKQITLAVSWDLGLRQYLFGHRSAFNKSNQTKLFIL